MLKNSGIYGITCIWALGDSQVDGSKMKDTGKCKFAYAWMFAAYCQLRLGISPE